MASFQARQREPLLDQDTQAVLERRGRELLGVVFLALAVMATLMLASYSPEDPSWMAVSDAPVQNWLGRIGAGIASPLIVIVGRGAWLLPVSLAIWGGRHILHRGEERVTGRMVFLPIAIAVAAVYAALLVPGAEWGRAYGLGGNFGDMIAGSLLGLSPVEGSIGLKLMTVVMAVLTLLITLFVTGFDRLELGALTRFLMLGTVASYAAAMTALGKGASASVRMAREAAELARERRAQAAALAQQQAAWQVQQDWQAGQQPQRADIVRAAVASRVRRPVEPEPAYAPYDIYDAPEAELVEPVQAWAMPEADAPSEDRIKARIQHAVKTRAPAPMPAPVAAPVPVAAPMAAPQMRAEPELYAPRLPAQPAPQPEAPASVLAAVSARLARGPKTPPAPIKRVEPPLQARPRYMPGTAPAAPAVTPVAAPMMAAPAVMPAMTAAPMPEPQEQDWSQPIASARQIEDVPAGDGWEEEAFERNVFSDLGEDLPQPAPMPKISALRATVAPPAPERRVMAPVRKPVAPSKQAIAEEQPTLRFDAAEKPAYEVPPLSLLTNPGTIKRHQLSDEALEENARMLESVLDDYGVKGEIVSVRPGPVVTMYELEPAPGLKASRVIGLADDIARSMSALSARVSTVPGRSVIGIELPNAHREKVVLREILSARDFGDSNMRLPLALGKDIAGEAVVANLAKMPHLLIAGTTGSGKSVAINTMILSLLYKLSPEECRLIMIDPKMLELSVYDGIPHLLSPVVTDPKKAVVALKWVVGEMEERYRRMSKMGVRNIEGYNGRVREAMERGEMFKRTVQTGFDEDTGEPVFETEEFQPRPFPYIVVIVDEMADLMMVAGKEIEACIQRLAQMARASGIHLIMATQRPSVDVITGTIKANFPTRISFQVTSKIDSRTILGEQGAEQLLGMGDMLYMGNGARITRIHGPFVSDEEVEEIVSHLKSFGPPEYMSGVVEGPDEEAASDIDAVLGLGSSGNDAEDALYDTAVAIVIKDRKCSTSYIQRKLGIGYNKAARLVEQMEEQGVVTPANHVGKREILVPEQ
ncbi:cell division protein FtsK [Rhodobacter capsulatus SB 1003]|uniref:DNA translocase FtsK n=1 Tax=Rhodobacter capsulatus (strain ATCC BAA-309 / NBRC 16581 / SB1003) TaxID=272942 RepID=D5AS30_RHOCB|nr:DNA translocase FtsK 4TM domain-containing protein [Rhodobacter capsulatus]ADE87052.1 cell division protein FtsK [Rhodobacter capsulatus SB 1003]